MPCLPNIKRLKTYLAAPVDAIGCAGSYEKGNAVGRFFRFLLMLVLLALLVAAAYVAIADIPPPLREIVDEVPQDVLFKGN